MSENKIEFDPRWLKAAALIAARQDIRYYLNGVLIEVFEHEARLVATDGHRLVILRRLIEGAAPAQIIIPTEIIALVKPSKNKALAKAAIIYDPAKPSGRATIEYLKVGIQFDPIDGKFPDYTQTMNKACKPSGEVTHFNLSYLDSFRKCAEVAFGANHVYQPCIWHNGNEPAAVTYMERDDFFGILMPMRVHDTFKAPAWTLPMPEPKREPEPVPA